MANCILKTPYEMRFRYSIQAMMVLFHQHQLNVIRVTSFRLFMILE